MLANTNDDIAIEKVAIKFVSSDTLSKPRAFKKYWPERSLKTAKLPIIIKNPHSATAIK